MCQRLLSFMFKAPILSLEGSGAPAVTAPKARTGQTVPKVAALAVLRGLSDQGYLRPLGSRFRVTLRRLFTQW